MFRTCILLFAVLSSAALPAQPVRVAVAANAQFVAGKLKEAFVKQHAVAIELTSSSSGKLTAQIEQGAPFHIFLSADTKYPQELYSKGLTTGPPRVYAYGQLVMWALQPVDLSKGLDAVLHSKVRTIALANPRLAPYGEAAVQALTRQGLLKKIQPKIVYGESIAQVNQYLLTGAADIAFTAKAVVLDAGEGSRGNWITVPSKLYRPIAQAAVIIKRGTAQEQANARLFYNFLYSSTARKIFVQYGYR